MPPVRTLKKRSEFLKVAATQQKWVTPGLILQARTRLKKVSQASDTGGGLPGSPEDRVLSLDRDNGLTAPGGSQLVGLGFTVTKKVGNAVERNRVKRRLRALAAELVPLHGRAGHDYVLIGRRMTLCRPFDRLKTDLKTALKRLKTKP